MRKLLIFGLIMLLVIGLAVSGCKTQQLVKPKANTNGAAGQNGGASGVEITPAEPVNVSKPISETAKTNADLQLRSAYWSTIYPEKGAPVDLKISVDNVGTEAVSGFAYNVKILKDGVMWKDETYMYENELPANDSTKLIKRYTFTDTGKYKAEVYLDRDNLLGERKRLNNAAISSELTVVTPASTTMIASTSGSSTTSNSGSCIDTDDGADEFKKGECDDGVSVFGINDYCKNSATLVEFSCGTDGLCKTEDIECDNGCENGVCA